MQLNRSRFNDGFKDTFLPVVERERFLRCVAICGTRCDRRLGPCRWRIDFAAGQVLNETHESFGLRCHIFHAKERAGQLFFLDDVVVLKDVPYEGAIRYHRVSREDILADATVPDHV